MDLKNFGTGDVAKSRVVDKEPGLDRKANFQVHVASSVFLSNLEKDALPQQQPMASSIDLSVLQFSEKNVFPLCSTTQNISSNEPSNTCDNNSEPDVHVHRTTDTPTNEFSENNVLFLEAFPHLFPLGKGMPFKGSIPNDYLVHLLCQGHNQFAGDAAFIFTACNQRMRHETLRSVSCKAKRNPSSMEQLGKLTKDPLFAKKSVQQ